MIDIAKSVSDKDVSMLFPSLPERTNKGDMGRVLCVCGSYDEKGISMCGAAYFAAMAAYRCGAGIVHIFTNKENYAALSCNVPEAVFSLYGDGENACDVAKRLVIDLKKADSVVLGCGLGKSDLSRSLVGAVLENVSVPLIIDADALNILSEDPTLWSLLSKEQRARTVITPHPGEASRLTGKSIDAILNATEATARELATERGVICLLKDHNTVITDGTEVYINRSGNAGMATAGMGDVLSGIMGAILARDADREQKDSILYRAAVAAYVHGAAGDVAKGKIGEYPLMARDVLEAISGIVMPK